jgi:hypothetical protein
MDRQMQIDMLRGAELQFRLATTVHLATTVGQQTLDVPVSWTYGNHNVSDELALTPEGADFAARLLKKSATFLMAVQVQEALTWFSKGKARNHSDPNVRSAFEVARLIRNAFTHQPLHPTWSIDPPCANRKFTVSDIITLDTAKLHGKEFDWQDYGGPLALLRLSQYIRIKILGDTNEGMARKKKAPNVTYHQVGSVILKQLS